MLAYLGLENAKNRQSNNNQLNEDNEQLHLPETSYRLIERLIKVYKTPHRCHRNVMDQETRFINSVVKYMKMYQSKSTDNETMREDDE